MALPGLVLCDVDGCLSPETPGAALDLVSLARIAHRNHGALAGDGRWPLTLCTGRPQPFAELLCRLLANHAMPAISENGVWIHDPGTNAYVMDPTITADHLGAVRALEDHLRATWCLDGTCAIQPGKTASVSVFTADRARLDAMQADTARLAQERGWPFRISATWCYLNCDLAHISKGTGAARLAQRLGLERPRLAGIGDTRGDLLLAERCAWFGCPANAEDAVRQRADAVAGAAEAAGVCELLDILDRRP
jgi:hydroxymethylpyrimidine pyrophosphatase-like HAD family hydrolase